MQAANNQEPNTHITQNMVSSPFNEFDLGLLVNKTRKSLPILVIAFFIACVSCFIYLRYSPYIYQASAIMQLNSTNTANKVLQVDNLYGDQDISKSVELLRSKVFFEKAITTLPLQTSYYAEGQVLDNELYLFAPFRVQAFVKDSSIFNTRFNINFPDEKNVAISYTFRDSTYSDTYPISGWIKFPHVSFKIQLINFQAVKRELKIIKGYYFKINNTESLVNSLIANLGVTAVNGAAQTIRITFQHNNPKKAADIVKAISENFLAYDVERRSESARNVLGFIDNQIKQVYGDLKISETSLQEFQKENMVSANDELAGIYIDKLSDLENQLVAIELEEKILQEIENSIQKQGNKIDPYNLIPLLTGTNFEANIADLITNLHQLMLQKEQLLYQLKPESEQIKNIEYNVNIQRKLLIESITSLQQRIIIKKKNITDQLKQFEESFTEVPAKELEIAKLRRIFNINEKFYTMLLEKRTEYSISEAGFVPESTILEQPSVPNTPISPKKTIAVAGFLAVWLIFSVLFIAVRYLLHNEITSLNDIKRAALAPIGILGIVPKYNQKIPVSQLLVDNKPKSIIAESFRSIRTNLEFINNSKKTKTIAVTSTVSGEGKTFVAINLGGIIAFSGKKVIILDLDMRKPKIHVGFGVENTKGMSTLLIKKNTIENCVSKSNLENLDFITAGPIPPNPSELIINGEIDNIINELKKTYDTIIIDNPPVGLVTDGISLISKADYPIYIFRAGVSKRNYVHNIDKLVLENKITNLSVILNGVDMERNSYYGYGYGYGYGGGYYDDEPNRNKNLKSIFSRRQS